jgi:hypothetical protein
MAIDSHRGILLPSEHLEERETFELSYITIRRVEIKTGKIGSGSGDLHGGISEAGKSI